jgi:hypothetical protein
LSDAGWSRILIRDRSTTSLQGEGIRALQNNSTETHSLVKKNHELLCAQAEIVLTVSRSLATSSAEQQRQKLDMHSIMLKVFETNMKIYKLVMQMQTLMAQLPPQIERQQPIQFEDAHGRVAPFHVEFISSFDAFQAVLEVRFRHVPGLRKVRRQEYSIQDARSKSRLDLRRNWEHALRPGRRITMSMTFNEAPESLATTCPGCRTPNGADENSDDAEIQW